MAPRSTTQLITMPMMFDTIPIGPYNTRVQASLGIWLLARNEAPANLKIREAIRRSTLRMAVTIRPMAGPATSAAAAEAGAGRLGMAGGGGGAGGGGLGGGPPCAP